MMPFRRCSTARITVRFANLAAYATVAALAACASPASRFYTLDAGNAHPAGEGPSSTARAANPAFVIEVPPVDVPTQIARNQLVVHTGDARVDVLEQERWASPPADEIRRALSGDLAARLGTFDVYGTPVPPGLPVYRITVTVRRFESWPGSRAILDAVWSVRAAGSQPVVTCRTLTSMPVGTGFPALVDGHRRAVARMADDIAATVRAFGQRGDGVQGLGLACAAGGPPSAKE